MAGRVAADQKVPRPRKTPALHEAIRHLAMGPLLVHKGDAEPGVKSLWQGFARHTRFVRRVQLMRLMHALRIVWNDVS
ncbi:IS4 family transposase [Zoogloea sp.]|uniref:IS4 family transposase n=1 Tax=Zoogloea sp. TaxID=49181 RepID=UPI00345BA829